MSIATFGEIMLRLTPDNDGDKLIRARTFSVDYAGAESNVASSLAVLGHETSFVSKLPDNTLGDAAIHALNSYGIETHHILRGGKRLGTYFIEQGSSIRPSRVLYDRADSAISTIAADEFDWETILTEQEWLHVSGITPALSEACAASAVEAARTASQLGVQVSFDLNFRRTLWRDAAEARQRFDPIIQHTDLLLGNTGVLKDVYDMDFPGSTLQEQTRNAVEHAHSTFGVSHIAFTVRDHVSASTNVLSGVFYTGEQLFASNSYTVDVLDRLGTGDAFAAACLHGLVRGWPPQNVIDFATAAFALKHTIRGDQHTSSEQEILSIMQGHTAGHVLR